MPGRQLGCRIDIYFGVVDSCRRLAETDRDQLQLAGIGRNIAGGKNPPDAGFHAGVDENRAVIEVEAPLRNRSEGRDEAEADDDRVDAQIERCAGFAAR